MTRIFRSIRFCDRHPIKKRAFGRPQLKIFSLQQYSNRGFDRAPQFNAAPSQKETHRMLHVRNTPTQGINQFHFLPTASRPASLASPTEAETALFDGLRGAQELYRRGSDRAAALASLSALRQFLVSFKMVRDEQLHIPLMNLSAALHVLNSNAIAEVVKPTAAGGRPPDSFDRLVLVGFAVGTVARLSWTGMPIGQACTIVATELDKLGVSTALGAITPRTLREWRARLDADRPTVRQILDGGREAIERATAGEIGSIVAIENCDAMLADKWRKRIKDQPRKAARKFILDSLHLQVRARVAGGNPVAPNPTARDAPANPLKLLVAKNQ
jgi:hypothetical protein